MSLRPTESLPCATRRARRARAAAATLAATLALLLLPARLAAGVPVHAAIGSREVPQAPSPGMDATSTGLVVGIVAAAYVSRSLGAEASTLSTRIDGTPLDRATDVANYYAEGYVLGPIALGLTAIGRASGRPRTARAGDDLAHSLLGAWSVTWALKLAIDARRPNGGRYSFPSGHCASAFAAAPVVSRHFGPLAGGGAYAMATLTALARLEDRRHHLWDVLAGAAIGLVAGRVTSEAGALRLVLPARGRGVGLGLDF